MRFFALESPLYTPQKIEEAICPAWRGRLSILMKKGLTELCGISLILHPLNRLDKFPRTSRGIFVVTLRSCSDRRQSWRGGEVPLRAAEGSARRGCTPTPIPRWRHLPLIFSCSAGWGAFPFPFSPIPIPVLTSFPTPPMPMREGIPFSHQCHNLFLQKASMKAIPVNILTFSKGEMSPWVELRTHSTRATHICKLQGKKD